MPKPKRVISFGPSPRVRGTESADRLLAVGCPVHPRVCGEQSPAASPTSLDGGPSPRVRGTGKPWQMGRCTVTASIPAVRGTVTELVKRLGIVGPSPGCGANRASHRCTPLAHGSIPALVREQHQFLHPAVQRIAIPACAWQQAT